MEKLKLEKLPFEIVSFEILTYLTIREMYNVSLCCKKFFNYVESNATWKIVCFRVFGEEFTPKIVKTFYPEEKKDWKKILKELLFVADDLSFDRNILYHIRNKFEDDPKLDFFFSAFPFFTKDEVIENVRKMGKEKFSEILIKGIRPKSNVKTQIFRDGYYVGRIKNGMRNGKGTFTYEKTWQGHWWMGSKYVGEFKNDNREGKGVSFFDNGDRFEGMFKNDYRHGKGVYYFANGERFEGNYVRGTPDGRCVRYFEQGGKEMSCTETYVNGTCVGK